MKKILILIFTVNLINIIFPVLYIVKYGMYTGKTTEDDKFINVYVKKTDNVIQMPTGQYLKEVVAAEMPAAFEPDALRAQAVAARSYLYARSNTYKKNGYPPEHKGADICTDPSHCKAYIPEDERKASWGDDADKYWKKIENAVISTEGEMVSYNGEVISCVFHSTSSGRTESSEDVWGGTRPYLISVESPGEELSPGYKSQLIVSKADFINIAKENIEGVCFDDELTGEIMRSEAGGIKSIVIGKVPIKGTVFRSIFNLKSTNVILTQTSDTVQFDVTGYGHGVGMSQYGANAMAKNGADYKEILTHYYTGTDIIKIN